VQVKQRYRLILLAVTLPAAFAVTSRLEQNGLTGGWEGTYRSEESAGTLRMQVDSAAKGWSVRLLATSEYVASPQFQDATDVRVNGDSISFSLRWGTPVSWEGRIRGDTLHGVLSTDHWAGTWIGVRSAKDGAARAPQRLDLAG